MEYRITIALKSKGLAEALKRLLDYMQPITLALETEFSRKEDGGTGMRISFICESKRDSMRVFENLLVALGVVPRHERQHLKFFQALRRSNIQLQFDDLSSFWKHLIGAAEATSDPFSSEVLKVWWLASWWALGKKEFPHWEIVGDLMKAVVVIGGVDCQPIAFVGIHNNNKEHPRKET